MGFLKKLNMLLCVSALSAGIIFCFCGFSFTVPKGAVVNGISIGGMTKSAAVAHLRAQTEADLKQKTLRIIGANEKYSFAYPEICYKDDFRSAVNCAKKNTAYTVPVKYYLCGLDEIAARICRNEHISKVEPYAQFNKVGAPFTYNDGNDGREADIARLKMDIAHSLKGGFEDINIKYHTVYRTTNLHTVQQNTEHLGTFSTYFDESNINRAHNIRLAAALLNGIIIQGGATFSFNQSVGARLPERGFLTAKIIENGEYVEGTGGGVCQVSSTLYNAALLSGMTITEYHPHSLAVGYVDPSRDAMVSGSSCDLKFVNSSKYPVYIRSYVSGGMVSFTLYGKSDGAFYCIESVITGTLPAAEEFTDDPSLVREGKDGIISEGYLVIKRGAFSKRVKLRTDKYLPIKRVVLTSSNDQLHTMPPAQTENGPDCQG